MMGLEGEAGAAYDARTAPMPVATHARPLRHEASALGGLPKLYVRFAGFPLFEATATRAAAEGWTVKTLSGGHLAPLAEPGTVATTIQEGLEEFA